MKAPAPVAPQLSIVTFRIGEVEFGVDVFSVHEILRYRPITLVPKAPEFVQGVIQVRGALVPVIDLRLRFEVADASIDNATRIVAVSFNGERLGLVVDAVTEVLQIPEAAVSAPPAYFHGLAAEYIRGIARLDERLVILLDLDRILSSEERIALEATDLTLASEEPVIGGFQPADSEQGEQAENSS